MPPSLTPTFSHLLGISSPWFVSQVDLSVQNHRVDGRHGLVIVKTSVDLDFQQHPPELIAVMRSITAGLPAPAPPAPAAPAR